MRRNLKLAPRFYGPYQIIQKLGSVAYKLDLPSTSRMHPIFHVSCLKNKLGQQILPIPTLPPVDHHGELKPELEAILDQRMRKIGQREAMEVLVQWHELPVEDSTCEVLYKLQDTYGPTHTLWARCFKVGTFVMCLTAIA
jgi:hypothetical protein